MEAQPEAPRILQNRPDLFDDLKPVWDAFQFLSSGRQYPNAISLSEMVVYFRDFVGEPDRDKMQLNVRLIRALDLEYLDIVRERHGS